jgi:hypothetical protein
MDLTRDDRENMQFDPEYIPNPIVKDRRSSVFHVPVGMDIAYGSDLVMSSALHLTVLCFPSFYQLLENEKFLLILVDRDKVSIYLECLPAMNMAIQRDNPIKILSREELGQDVLFAFDETKRALAVCASIKVLQY